MNDRLEDAIVFPLLMPSGWFRALRPDGFFLFKNIMSNQVRRAKRTAREQAIATAKVFKPLAHWLKRSTIDQMLDDVLEVVCKELQVMDSEEIKAFRTTFKIAFWEKMN